MDHRIEAENLCTIHFDKVLASEVDKDFGESKSLNMYVVVDHYKNYIESKYKVVYELNNPKVQTMMNQWEPTHKEWDFTMIDLAVDKYNEL